MRQRFIIWFFFVVFWGSGMSVLAQNLKKNNNLTVDIEYLLPPLDTIIDLAIKNNPNVRFRDLQIVVNKSKLLSDKRQWARDLGLQTDMRYGTFNNFSTNTAEGQTPSNVSTLSNQLNYGFGAYVKLPFFDLINRKNQINLSQAEVEQAESMAVFQRNEIRQAVIKLYYDLVNKQRIFKIKSKYAETSKINMELTQKDFTKGTISLEDYTRLSESAMRTEVDYETAKVDFLTAYLILEDFVGTKFNLF